MAMHKRLTPREECRGCNGVEWYLTHSIDNRSPMRAWGGPWNDSTHYFTLVCKNCGDRLEIVSREVVRVPSDEEFSRKRLEGMQAAEEAKGAK